MQLRAPEIADIDRIYLWDNMTDELHTSLRTGPLSRHCIQQWVEKYDGDIFASSGVRFMIDVDGETVGTVDVFDFDRHSRHAFVGIYIAAAHRRKGYARRALNDVCRRMSRDVSMRTLAAIVATDNNPSACLFRSAGFAEVGVLKDWIADGIGYIDAILFQTVL